LKDARTTLIKYSIPPFVTILLLSMVLYLKKIFPFGANTIDYYDMGQQIAAFYYHVYDALHGTKSLFFDWYSALGTNMTMNTSGCSSISIFNLLLYFVPRDMILQYLSVFTMIKMACMSLTMYHFLHKTIKADYLWEFCFSICYGISGFAMMYYITNQWLDVAVFLPLLMYALIELCSGKKIIPYVVYLVICLTGSYYQSFMILIFVILSVGTYYMTVGREYYYKNRDIVMRLGLATLVAMGLSAFILFPQLVQTFGSTRFSNNAEEGNFYLGILKQVKGEYTTRWWSLLGLSLSFAVIVRGFIKEKNKKINIFFVSMLVMMCLEFFVESINLMWHFGSYVGYPIRNGFIINFFVLATACYYAKYQKIQSPQNGTRKIYAIVLGIVLVFGTSGSIIAYYASRKDMVLRQVFHMTAGICAVTFLVYLLLLLKNSRWVMNLLLVELSVFLFIMIGKPNYITGYSEAAEQSGTYIALSNQLADQLEIETSKVKRIKNSDTELNANYAFVLQRSAISNWTHMISPSFQIGAGDWGYSIQYMRVLDAGGTAFSDALIGITQTLSQTKLPEELYHFSADTRVEADGKVYHFTLYDNQYRLPFGVVIPEQSMEYIPGNADRFATQNEIFALLAPDEKAPLIETVCRGNGVLDGEQQIQVDGKKVLYFTGETRDSSLRNISLCVNGEMIKIPTIGDASNEKYPAYFDNSMICLGVFEDETVSISLVFDEIAEELHIENDESFQIGALDLSMLERLCDSYQNSAYDEKIVIGNSNLSLDVEADSDKASLLLPVQYDKGFLVTNNGVKTECKSASGIFTLIPLWKGSNHIEVVFFPTGMKEGIIISVFSFVCMGVWFAIHKRQKEKASSEFMKKAERFCFYGFMCLWGLMILFMYIIPILYIPLALFL